MSLAKSVMSGLVAEHVPMNQEVMVGGFWVRAHPGVAGSIPSWGACRKQPINDFLLSLMFLFLCPSTFLLEIKNTKKSTLLKKSKMKQGNLILEIYLNPI